MISGHSNIITFILQNQDQTFDYIFLDYIKIFSKVVNCDGQNHSQDRRHSGPVSK